MQLLTGLSGESSCFCLTTRYYKDKFFSSVMTNQIDITFFVECNCREKFRPSQTALVRNFFSSGLLALLYRPGQCAAAPQSHEKSALLSPRAHDPTENWITYLIRIQRMHRLPRSRGGREHHTPCDVQSIQQYRQQHFFCECMATVITKQHRMARDASSSIILKIIIDIFICPDTQCHVNLPPRTPRSSSSRAPTVRRTKPPTETI